jgi:hypothetical protein
MRNHNHLVLETPDANLVAGMAWLQSCVMGSDTAANRQEFERRMETRKLAVTDEAA